MAFKQKVFNPGVGTGMGSSLASPLTRSSSASPMTMRSTLPSASQKLRGGGNGDGELAKQTQKPSLEMILNDLPFDFALSQENIRNTDPDKLSIQLDMYNKLLDKGYGNELNTIFPENWDKMVGGIITGNKQAFWERQSSMRSGPPTKE
tara:strand:+ start:278 stop:724 length:447 start_codon:yes stop_codon:yes gene_type:complete